MNLQVFGSYFKSSPSSWRQSPIRLSQSASVYDRTLAGTMHRVIERRSHSTTSTKVTSETRPDGGFGQCLSDDDVQPQQPQHPGDFSDVAENQERWSSRRPSTVFPPQAYNGDDPRSDDLGTCHSAPVSRPSPTASSYACSPVAGLGLLMAVTILLMVCSLLMIGMGASLMGFYRVHMLEVISPIFVATPVLILSAGLFTLVTAVFGLFAAARGDSCLLIVHAFLLALSMLVTLGGVILSVRLTFTIRAEMNSVNFIQELNDYNSDSWVRHKWDTIQREFSCCGAVGEHGYTMWKQTVMGNRLNAVPDSCCIVEFPDCGRNVFSITTVATLAKTISMTGCIKAMEPRLRSHVQVILVIFAIGGGTLTITEIMCIVLTCCMSYQSEKHQDDPWEQEGYRPSTPQNQNIHTLHGSLV